jgi:hypothetical protein
VAASRNLTDAEKSLRGTLASHASWANTENRSARTLQGRLAMLAKFEAQVDPDGKLTPAERAKRAESARKEHMARMSFLAAKGRRRAAADRSAEAGDVE